MEKVDVNEFYSRGAVDGLGRGGAGEGRAGGEWGRARMSRLGVDDAEPPRSNVDNMLWFGNVCEWVVAQGPRGMSGEDGREGAGTWRSLRRERATTHPFIFPPPLQMVS